MNLLKRVDEVHVLVRKVLKELKSMRGLVGRKGVEKVCGCFEMV